MNLQYIFHGAKGHHHSLSVATQILLGGSVSHLATTVDISQNILSFFERPIYNIVLCQEMGKWLLVHYCVKFNIMLPNILNDTCHSTMGAFDVSPNHQ